MLIDKVIHKPMGLFRATSIVMVATIASAVFGLLRETLVAAHFGTTVETDAYFFAFDLIVRLPEFMLAAIGASLIPLYMRSKKEGHNTPIFVSTVINAYLLLLLFVGLLLVGTAPLIAATLASGLDPAGQELVTQMIWALSPTIFLVGLWGVLKTLLNAEREFFISTISQTLQSLGIIGAVILLASPLGIYSLPVGILIGSGLQVLWTAIPLRRNGLSYGLKIDLNDPLFRRFLVLLGPGLIGGLIGYLSPLIDRSLASHLDAGTIASLSFAERPMAILTRIAVYSFLTALLPALSWEAHHSNHDSFRATVVRTLGILMFVTTPLSLLLAALRVPIIQMLFERGKFTAVSTASTADIFAGLVIGLMPMAIAVTLSTIFTSLEDTKTPAVFGAGINFIANVAFDLLLIGPLGAVGLALATSLKYVISGTILLFLLRRRLRGLGGSYLAKAFIRILVAALLAVSPVYLMATYGAMPPLVLITIGMLGGVSLFLICAALLRAPEPALAYNYLLRLKNHRVVSSFLK